MRKLIISTIIILPIILLAILLVSGAILSLVTHIYVEALEFSNNKAIVLVMDDEEHPPVYNLADDITILPVKASDRRLTYTADKEGLLDISSDGILTARFFGQTTVTVRSKENTSAIATRTVIVTDSKVHLLRMEEYDVDLYEGQSQKLSVSIFPEEADNTAIKWESSAPTVLQVNQSGMVTALGSGSVTITATSLDNPDAKATATINCHSKLQDVTFDSSLVVTSQKTTNFPDVSLDPLGCDVTKKFSSSNTDIAEVDDNGLVTFKKAGKVSITLTVTDFGNTSVEVTKDFVSTFGYFVGPLFMQKEVLSTAWDASHPIEFARNLDGAYQKIESIQCFVDGSLDVMSLDEEYMKQNLVVKFVGDSLPTFDEYIEIKVSAKVFSFKTEQIETYEDSLRISKVPSEIAAQIKKDGAELSQDAQHPTEIKFFNIGQQISLTLENQDDLLPSVVENAFVGIRVEGNTIILSSKAACKGQRMTISIGRKTYVLSISIDAKAERLNVFCNGQKLYSNNDYQTLLDKLSFSVKPVRNDGQQVTEPILFYKTNNHSDWQPAVLVGGKIEVETEGVTTISFKCDEQELSFNLIKTTLEDFGFDLSAQTSGADIQIGSVSGVKEETMLTYNLPSDLKNTITFKIQLPQDFLGGVGDDTTFAGLFPINLDNAQGWAAEHNALNMQIDLILAAGEQSFNKTIKIGSGETSVEIQLLKVELESISFTGYDSTKTEDVYAGYQQVRVFAKHSWISQYDEAGAYVDGKLVDYLEIPYEAYAQIAPQQQDANPDVITWRLSRYVGNHMEKEITTQCGKEVTYHNAQTGETEKYVVVLNAGTDQWVLKKADDLEGAVISGEDGKNPAGITWVDVYSHPGFARIYFGNFAGLSKTDVFNSYFGAFDDDEDWTTPEICTDQSSGDFNVAPSDSAFSFMRVEAGDGVLGGKNNCHFNFNVVNDNQNLNAPQIADLAKVLVNIFDADGFYKCTNIVLQTNLYGPGEFSSDEVDKSKVLDLEIKAKSDSKLDKELVYGNGKSINLEKLNQWLVAYPAWLNEHPKEADAMNGWTIGNNGGATYADVCNATIKGCNPTETFNDKNHAIVFVVNHAYFSSIQHYYKINGKGGENAKTYFRNSVLSNAIKVVQPYYDGQNFYFENTVITDCILAICFENGKNLTCNMKGFNDVLNYTNGMNLYNSLGSVGGLIISAWYEQKLANPLDSYTEWFGQKAPAYNSLDHRYLNTVAFASNSAKQPFEVKFWNEETKDYTGGNLLKRLLEYDFGGAGVYGWTYDYQVDVDGGVKNPSTNKYTGADRDMTKLFNPERYIRLLCQYKTNQGGKLVRNDEHILWHTQQVFRDKNILKKVTGAEQEDHIDNLKRSLITTKQDGEEVLTDLEWSDKSGIYKDGTVHGIPDATTAAEYLNKLVSCAILPKKQQI